MPKSKNNLFSFNKKQLRLIERFEKVAKQMDDAHVTICIDEESNDILFVNTTHLADNMVTGRENLASNLDIEMGDNRIIEAEGMRADISVAFIYDSEMCCVPKSNYKIKK